MIGLDDLRWKDLRHAYGDASDIPAMLRKLSAAPGPTSESRQEPWFSLWSSLCHQGDVYTASYAATPHIVQIAENAKGPVDSSFFSFPACVEIARQTGNGPTIPKLVENEYRHAISLLPDCVSLHRAEDWDLSMLLSASAALAVAKGHIEAAEAMLNLDADWIEKINGGE